MRGLSRIFVAFASMVIVPSALYAQASIAGVVKDTSGAVLPGVTVETSSPALIEKTRSVVTDGTGQYRIVDLRPGTYTVTFTLGGFSIVKREGIELTGSFTATVNADMRVGAVEETVTVTGETPIVDIQNTTRQKSMAHDVIDAIPTGRLAQNLGVLVPGVTVASSLTFNGIGGQDVGGSSGNMVAQLASHGGRGLDSRTFVERHVDHAVGRRQQYALRGQYGQHAGSDDRYVRRVGGSGRRRRADQPHPQGRRQHLQRLRVRHVRERVDAKQQLHRRSQGQGLDERQLHQEGCGLQSGVRRADHEGQAVVLHVRIGCRSRTTMSPGCLSTPRTTTRTSGR